MNKIIDNLVAFRILYLLVLPFDKTDAFKLGIIDKNGKLLIPVKDFTTQDQQNAYNYLVRLIFNLKRLIAKIPGGSSMLGTIVTAYFLIKEGIENGDLNNLDEKFEILHNQINEGLVLVEETILVEKFLVMMSEDGVIGGTPTNSVGSGAVAGKDNPMTLKRRNNWKDLPKAFGITTFEVSDNTFNNVRNAKDKGVKWDKHIIPDPSDNETFEKIKGYSKTYSKNPIAIKRKGHEHFQFLKNPHQ